jgi:hypothetical protein
MNNVILITGYARAGKDTLADGIALAASGPVAHLNFADVLKQACDSYMQMLEVGGSGSARTFRNEAFKVKHRDFLVSAGMFARSIDPHVFALAFTRECNRTAKMHDEPNLTIVCSDWRYLNELTIVNEILGRNGWAVYTVHIQTPGRDAAAEEEGKSIGEIIRNVPVNFYYQFKPDSKQDILNEGKSLARQLGL